MTIQLLAMSKKDIDRHDVLKRLIRKEIKRSHAAKLLRLTVRHVTRLKHAIIKYLDFGPTFATEKLLEIHKIDHDPKTIRAIQMKEGLLFDTL